MEIMANSYKILTLFLLIVLCLPDNLSAIEHQQQSPGFQSTMRFSGPLSPGDTIFPKLFEFLKREKNNGINPYHSYSNITPDLSTISFDYNCEYTINTYDPLMGKNKRELGFEEFFSYSPGKLKPYLQQRKLLVANGKLTSINGGYKYLTLSFYILSKSAPTVFGKLKQGSLLRLFMMDGKTVTLYNSSESNPKLDKKGEGYSLTGIYPIDASQEKILGKVPIDKVRVVWSTGYEDYPIYHVNFFEKQLNCLNRTLK